MGTPIIERDDCDVVVVIYEALIDIHTGIALVFNILSDVSDAELKILTLPNWKAPPWTQIMTAVFVGRPDAGAQIFTDKHSSL